MLKNTIRQIRRHPVASSIYTVYIIYWISIIILTYHDLTSGSSELIETVIFYSSWCLFVPYLIINIVFAQYSKIYRRFYRKMTRLVAMPLFLLILVYIEHWLIGYLNKGV
jgi:hypothetical protein